MEIWIASTNKGKINEIKDLFKDLPLEVHSALELSTYAPPPETGLTFGENARIKAKSLKVMKNDAWVLSDDSGLEVRALKNLPGVHSARYAGPRARDIENVSKLLKQIQIQTNGEDRSAQFKCVMCLLGPDGSENAFEGILTGSISRDMRGKQGFGYDPVFVPEGDTRTLAEMDLATKNKLSHRAQALKRVKEFLKTKM